MLNLYQGPIQFSNRLFSGFDALARHRFLSILLVACLSFGGCCLWALFRGIPIPYVQDEFNYLLEGDTFAHGHITNPMHPMRYYFEAVDILQQPTYMSKYQPGQGIFLAIGQVLFGHLIYGVWLSSALMCAAISWMLYAWVSPRWALMGGLVSVLQFGIFTYWNQSYWGGAVAGIGGALVFGALPRIIKFQRLRDAFFLGLGIGILAITRPLEGILFGIPLGYLLLPWKHRWQWVDKRRIVRYVLLPLSLMILIIAVLIGAYNKKITGNAFELPYILYEKQYESIPLFIWQPLNPLKQYNHKALADYENYYTTQYYPQKRTWAGFFQDIYQDSCRVGMFFLGFPLALPSLVIIIKLFCGRKTMGRYIISLCIILSMMGMLPFPAKPHYFAALACLAVLLITIGLKGLFSLNFRQKQVGPVIIITLISLQFLLNITLTPMLPVAKFLAQNIQGSPVDLPASFSREDLKNILMKQGGKYLVIVKQYPLWKNFDYEWVFNDADIDRSPIVWARDMGTGKNAELLQYFKDRHVLMINVAWDRRNPYHNYYARQ